MSEIDELKEQIKNLNEKIGILEEKLKENSENDDKRHREFLDQQQKQHNEKMKWDKMGGIGGILTSVAGSVGLITWIIKLWKGDERKNDGDKDLWNY